MSGIERLSPDTHKRNISKIQKVLAKKRLDAILILNPNNVYYVTGFAPSFWERPHAVLVPQSDEPVLFVPSNKEGEAREQTQKVIHEDNIEVYSEYPYTTPSTQDPSMKWVSPEPTFKWICRKIEKSRLKGKALGVEDNYTSIEDSACENWFDQVHRYFDGRVAKAGTIVMDLRIFKEPEELKLIRKACEYADLVVKNISEELEEGLTELEVMQRGSAKTSEMIKKEIRLGAEARGIIDAGVKSGTTIHGGFMGWGEDYVIENGDPFIINSGASVFRYHGESERCGVVGKPTEKQWKYFNIAMESQLRAREAIKPGVTCSEIDKVAIDVIRAAGQMVRYGVGHGIGLQGHEPPWIRIGSKTVLEPGMTFTVEPGLAVPGVGAFHNSDTVLVTEDGYEALTKYEGNHRFLLD